MFDGKYTLIDAHCHVYPDKIAAKAIEGITDFYREVGAGVDGSPWGAQTGCEGTVGGLLREGKEAGSDHFVICSVATLPRQVRSVNRFIAEAVASHPGKMTGLGTLHPDSEDLRGDVEDIVSLGLHGVKLHPDTQHFQADSLGSQRIYELLEEYQLPVLIHTGDFRYDNANPNRMLPMVRKFPNVTFVGAHFGGWSMFEEATDAFAGIPNFYVDCSSTQPYLSNEKMVELIRRYGADRVMFGTDYPMWKPSNEVERFKSLDLTEAELEMVLSGTARKLYRISL